MVDVIHGFYFLYKHPCRESHPDTAGSHPDVTFLLDCDFLTMVHILDPVKKTPLDIFKQAFFDRFKPSPINKDILRIQQPGEGV